MTGLRSLTLWQPWASLIAAGVKTIETRSWETKHRGRIAIHAGAASPDDGLTIGDWCVSPNWHAGAPCELVHHADGVPGAPGRIPLPLGAIVATANLVDCVPIHDTCTDPIPDDLLYVTIDGKALFRQQVTGDPSIASNVITTELTDQLPYGDYRPGRWAWLLDDIKPTTSRCPACWGERVAAKDPQCGDPHHRHTGSCYLYAPRCPVCDGAGHCDPIPAKGKRGLWTWTPESAAEAQGQGQ